jgi:2-dehydro-3-deoxygluconokinase
MLAFMEQKGIGTRHISKLAKKAPGLYMISLKDGERSFTYWRDSSAARHLADDTERLGAAIAAADVIFFSGITLAILPPAARSVFLGAMAKAKADGKAVAFDSNIRMRLWPGKSEVQQAIAAAAKTATLALPTGEDEFAIFGDESSKDVAARYRSWGVPEIVVKCGGDPATIVHGDRELLIGPSEKVVPADTTGAGDSFNGAYIAARLAGRAPEPAARSAHANAARVIQSYGALV